METSLADIIKCAECDGTGVFDRIEHADMHCKVCEGDGTLTKEKFMSVELWPYIKNWQITIKRRPPKKGDK